MSGRCIAPSRDHALHRTPGRDARGESRIGGVRRLSLPSRRRTWHSNDPGRSTPGGVPATTSVPATTFGRVPPSLVFSPRFPFDARMTVAMAPASAASPSGELLVSDQVQVRTCGDAIVVRPRGSVEGLPWELVEEASTVLLAPLSGRAAPLVVFDLAELSNVGSVLLNLLLKCHRQVASAGGEFVICHASDAVRDLIRITALDTVWAMYDTRDEALEAIGA